MTANPTQVTAPNGTKPPVKEGDVVNGRVVKRVPLAEIWFDPRFNVRVEKFTGGVGDGGAEQGTEEGVTSLKLSLTEYGQDTAGLVRPLAPNTPGAPKGTLYSGVAGFRRSLALTQIAAESVKAGVKHPLKGDPEWDSSNPTILVTIREMTNLEAHLANLRENTARDELRAPDLAFGLLRLQEDFKAEKGGEKRGAAGPIARGLGKGESYVRRLLVIADKTSAEKTVKGDMTIFEDWRTSQKFVPVHSMHELLGNPGPYAKQYEALKNATPGNTTTPPDPNKSKTAWLDKAVEAAQEIGRVVGIIAQRNERTGEEQGDKHIGKRFDTEAVVWDEPMMRALLKFKKGADGRQKNSIIAAAKRGVKKGREEVLSAIADAEAAEAAEAEAEKKEAEEKAAKSAAAAKKGK